jgi:hypothetical protein
MPQLDFISFFPQTLGMYLVLLAFYFQNAKNFLPQLNQLLLTRDHRFKFQSQKQESTTYESYIPLSYRSSAFRHLQDSYCSASVSSSLCQDIIKNEEKSPNIKAKGNLNARAAFWAAMSPSVHICGIDTSAKTTNLDSFFKSPKVGSGISTQEIKIIPAPEPEGASTSLSGLNLIMAEKKPTLKTDKKAPLGKTSKTPKASESTKKKTDGKKMGEKKKK